MKNKLQSYWNTHSRSIHTIILCSLMALFFKISINWDLFKGFTITYIILCTWMLQLWLAVNIHGDNDYFPWKELTVTLCSSAIAYSIELIIAIAITKGTDLFTPYFWFTILNFIILLKPKKYYEDNDDELDEFLESFKD